MSRIKWQETLEFEPPELLIRNFCQTNRIAPVMLDGSPGMLAFIEREALVKLNAFLLGDLSRERSGLLLGQPFYDPEEKRYFTVVLNSVPAKETEGSPVHFRFTPQTWAYISGVVDQNYSDMLIVGWYHSHPGLSVFMSSTDRATQRAFHNHPWNLAVVVDPIAQKTGWFAGGECTPLDKDQVVTYEDLATQETPADEIVEATTRAEGDGRNAPSSSQFPWLLPFVGMTALALAAGAIWFLRTGRFRTRAASS
jgi:proteasome lid subunit RPN8/RPN11